jgi:excisionase family DNA binding protein
MSSTLTIPEVAHELRISEEHARRLVTSGQIPGLKLGKVWRIPRAQWDAYLEGRWQPTPPATPVPMIARRKTA